MPGESQPAKKRRLPFNPPRRASPGEGPSTSKAPNAKKSNDTVKRKNTDISSSLEPKQKRKSTGTSTSKAPSRKQQEQPTRSPSPAAASENSNNSGSSRSRSPSSEPDYILAEISHANHDTADVTTSDPAIPPKLLTRLLHHNFQNEKTKVAKDANEIVAKYVDVFVREALARAAFERAEGGAGEGGSGERTRVSDGFLEVEDLEKMAPQLVLDF